MKRVIPFVLLSLLFACKKHNSSSAPSGHWTQTSNFLESEFVDPVGFMIGNQLYVGMGSPRVDSERATQCLAYNDSSNSWSVIRNYFYPTDGTSGIGFSIGGAGYVLLGHDSVAEMFTYDASGGFWNQTGSYPGELATATTAFSVNGKAYVGFGASPVSGLHTFYQYDPVTFNWSVEGDFPGTQNIGMTSFVIGNYAYVGTGGVLSQGDTAMSTQFFRYDPAHDSWTPCANFPGTPRSYASGFSVGNMGYIVGGIDANGDYLQDVWQYDPVTGKWSRQADFPGGARSNGLAFSGSTAGYFGFGHGTNGFSDLWEFQP